MKRRGWLLISVVLVSLIFLEGIKHQTQSTAASLFASSDENSGSFDGDFTDIQSTEPFRVEECPELCDYPDIHAGRVVYEDHRGPGIEVYGWDLNLDNEFQVIHDTTHQHFPVIYGDIVAYTDLRYSTQGLDGTDIFAMNIATHQEFEVTTAPGQQINLAIGPRYIVWEDDRDGYTGANNGSNRDIYGYDMLTGQEFPIATGAATQLHPDIHGNVVVWSQDGNIVGRDLATGTNFEISMGCCNRLRPAIHGDLVIWESWSWDNGWDIVGYRFSTGEEFPIAVAPGDQNYADVSADLIVWQDMRHGNWDIYVHVIETGEQFPVSRNARKQKWPAVDGNIVVWSDFIELEPQIYGFIFDGTPPPGVNFAIEDNPTNLIVGAFPGGVIPLTWQDNSDEETHYVVERHTGMLGTTYEILATLPANTTAYTDTNTISDTVYWYRVYAQNDAGVSATTNESYNVALPNDLYPNEQERYLQVLINEVRSDPAAFGYPTHPPQPPVVLNPGLNYAARAHAIASRLPGGSGGHVDWADRGPGDRAVASGFDHLFVSENMFTFGFPDAASVESANLGFLNSHGHRDNMLVAGNTETGLGFYYHPDFGGSWVETFAGREALQIPYLPAGAVAPFTGNSSITFTYSVNYHHPDGLAPTEASVIIDGASHPMGLATGSATNGTYKYVTMLAPGNHTYCFFFSFPGGSAYLPDRNQTLPTGRLVVKGNELAIQGNNQVFLPLILKPSCGSVWHGPVVSN
ncbi:MAG: hypothetical protein KJ069_16085 [Anaerolineae bacterium]|nr:hypothetical protein [Anaerolineae bacterium]